MSGKGAPGLGVALALLCLAPTAHAQVGASAALASDYRLRGISLTDRRPAFSVSATYDHPSGIYAGGSVIAHDPAAQGARILGHQEYLGVAGRLAGGGLSWDVGVNNVDMNLYFDRRYELEYTEIYVGLSQSGLSGRLSLAPDYPRKGVATAYAELNGVLRPAESWRLTSHVGAQTRLSGSTYRDGKRTRYDVTVGVVREFEACEAHLSWTAVSPRPQPPMSWTRPGFVAGVSFFF